MQIHNSLNAMEEMKPTQKLFTTLGIFYRLLEF